METGRQKRVFLETVRRTILEHRLLETGDRVLVGVSGGPDSMALFHALRCLASEWRIDLGVAHFNHGLRGRAADRDEAFVRHQAESWRVPCFFGRATPDQHAAASGEGPEAGARHLRFGFFRRTARENGYDRIALGHHADDNAELVLMRLIRGSGPAGLGGIQPIRTHHGPGGPLTVIRPLLETHRKAILAFLEAVGSGSVDDRSNRDRRFLRNRVRHDLIPHLAEAYNPAIAAGLNRLAVILRDEAAWLSEMVEAELEARILPSDPGVLELATEGFDRLQKAFQRRLVQAAILRTKGRSNLLRFGHVDAVRGLALGRLRGRLHLPGRLQVEQTASGLRFHLAPAGRNRRRVSGGAMPSGFEYRLDGPGTVMIAETGWQVRATCVAPGEDTVSDGRSTALFDMVSVAFPIVIRSFRPGDRFSPSGVGGRQKVKKFFIDRKIPRADRLKIPLLLSKGTIFWIAGLRRADIGPPGPATRQALMVELLVV